MHALALVKMADSPATLQMLPWRLKDRMNPAAQSQEPCRQLTKDSLAESRIKAPWRKFSHSLAGGLHLAYPLASRIALNLEMHVTMVNLLFHPVQRGVFSLVSSCLCSITENWEGLRRR